MFIAVAQIEAVRVLPFDLRTYAYARYLLAYRPLLYCFAQPPTDPQSAMAFSYYEPTQFYYVRRLQMPFNAGVCPSHNDVFQNCDESDAVW